MYLGTEALKYCPSMVVVTKMCHSLGETSLAAGGGEDGSEDINIEE